MKDLENQLRHASIYGINIEGIIIKGAEHLTIFDSRCTPTSHFLVDQLLDFYYKSIPLNPNGEGCCPNIDQSYQNARNETLKAHNDMEL